MVFKNKLESNMDEFTVKFDLNDIPLPPLPSSISHNTNDTALGAIFINPEIDKAEKCLEKENVACGKVKSYDNIKTNSLDWIGLQYSDDSDETESENENNIPDETGQITKHLLSSSMPRTKLESEVSSATSKTDRRSRSGKSTHSVEATPKSKEKSVSSPLSEESDTSKSMDKCDRFTPKMKKKSYSSTPEMKEETDCYTPKSKDKIAWLTLKRKLERSDGSTPKRKWEESNEIEWHSVPKEKKLREEMRRSLPSNLETNSFLKRSSLGSSPLQSPRPRSCLADQTPYAEEESKRRKFQRTSLPAYSASDLVPFESDHGFIDSHCHLDFLFQRQGYSKSYACYQELHKDTYPASYKGCLAVFCNPFTFKKKDLWGKYLSEDKVWAAFGCHPHNAKDYNDIVEESLCSALKHPKVRALGEIGLDYSNRNGCQKEIQFEVLRRQLKIAKREGLNVVIHCREAHEDAMTIIKEILPTDYTIHLHCFTDTWEKAQQWLNEFPNLFIGITNVVTFPSAECVHEVAQKIPLSRLLLETDAPYFIPRALSKGTKYSHPGMAIHVAAQIAALKDVTLEEVLKATRENTRKMYSI